jgi:hypothetical protein
MLFYFIGKLAFDCFAFYHCFDKQLKYMASFASILKRFISSLCEFMDLAVFFISHKATANSASF